MLLQHTLNQCEISLTPTVSYSHQLPWKRPHFTPQQSPYSQKIPVKCSISQIHTEGTVCYDKRPIVRWYAIYRKISLMQNPEMGLGSVLDEWDNNRKGLAKGELSRIIKELRKYKRYWQALEVYDWMNGKEGRFRVDPSDAAIQLDLIAKLHGVSRAEKFFMRLRHNLKDRRVYGALLNAYAHAKMRDKAESLISRMRRKGYFSHALPYNVMMTLYMDLKEYDKVDSMASEMIEKGIQLDICSYNIWLSSFGSQGSATKMEKVFEQMKFDESVVPNWTTFCTMASMYIKMGFLEKAEDCLRRFEGKILGRDRRPFHYILSLYGKVGKNEEVYRIWKVYKSVFHNITNSGYLAIISPLVRMGDIEGAEKLYEEWLSIKTTYEPRIGNLLMSWHVKEGNVDKAESYFDHLLESGRKPDANTWEILAEGYIGQGRISEALSCFEKAFASDGSKYWKPRPVNISHFFMLCEEEADMASKDALEALLRQSGYLEDNAYASHVGMPEVGDLLSAENNETTNEYDEENVESDWV